MYTPTLQTVTIFLVAQW